MKRFLTAAIILACTLKASACAIERSDHNYYMFSVIQRECMDPAYLDDINNYWKTYAGQADNQATDFYKWNKDDSMNASSTLAYYQFLTSKTDDAFEQYVKDKVYTDSDFFQEMIGTKYLREGDFDEAARYLKNVSQQFIDGQRISFYMAQRSYAIPRWFQRQKAKNEESFLYTDFSDVYAHVKGNVKLKYCQEMSQMIQKYNLSREGTEKDQLAYDLAVRYYQASCYGDCWYLTHYGQSVADSARTGELDFAAQAIKYLKVCAQSSQLDLRYKATYALAFIPIEPWYDIDYDANYNAIIRPLPSSAQYQALAALDRFAIEHPQAIDQYTSRCDVLKRFRNAK